MPSWSYALTKMAFAAYHSLSPPRTRHRLDEMMLLAPLCRGRLTRLALFLLFSTALEEYCNSYVWSCNDGYLQGREGGVGAWLVRLYAFSGFSPLLFLLLGGITYYHVRFRNEVIAYILPDRCICQATDSNDSHCHGGTIGKTWSDNAWHVGNGEAQERDTMVRGITMALTQVFWNVVRVCGVMLSILFLVVLIESVVAVPFSP